MSASTPLDLLEQSSYKPLVAGSPLEVTAATRIGAGGMGRVYGPSQDGTHILKVAYIPGTVEGDFSSGVQSSNLMFLDFNRRTGLLDLSMYSGESQGRFRVEDRDGHLQVDVSVRERQHGRLLASIGEIGATLHREYKLLQLPNGAQHVFYVQRQPFVRGRNLASLHHVPTREAYKILQNLALQMGEVRRRGVVHHDLKPANAIVNLDTLKVSPVDFGLARRISGEAYPVWKDDSPDLRSFRASMNEQDSGDFCGTPLYASPRSILVGHDPWADAYSFGLIAYELITGAALFEEIEGGDDLIKLVSHLKFHHHSRKVEQARRALAVAGHYELAELVECALGGRASKTFWRDAARICAQVPANHYAIKSFGAREMLRKTEVIPELALKSQEQEPHKQTRRETLVEADTLPFLQGSITGRVDTRTLDQLLDSHQPTHLDL